MKKNLFFIAALIMISAMSFGQQKYGLISSKYPISVQGKTLSGAKIAQHDSAYNEVMNNDVDIDNFFVKRSDSLYNSLPEWYTVAKRFGSNLKPLLPLLSPEFYSSSPLTANRVQHSLMYCYATTTITGVKLQMYVQGVYVGDAAKENGVALYRVSNDSLILLGKSANTTDIWKSATFLPITIPFSTPITISPGKYAIGAIYNSTSQTTAPAIGGVTSAVLLKDQSLSGGMSYTMTWLTQNTFQNVYSTNAIPGTPVIYPTFLTY